MKKSSDLHIETPTSAPKQGPCNPQNSDGAARQPASEEDEELQMRTEYCVTGVRYQMGDNLTDEERTAAAERFLASLQKGEPLTLAAEPDNPFDPHAIAVYRQYDRIGYIVKEETDEIRPLLDKNGHCGAAVERSDGHVTLFITIPAIEGALPPAPPRERQLPPSPLAPQVRMPFTEAEHKLLLIASQLVEIAPKPANRQQIVEMSEHYVGLMKLTLCREEALWRGMILNKLNILSRRCKSDQEKIMELYYKVNEAIGDIRSTIEHGSEKLFVAHLERLRTDVRTNRHLFQKFSNEYLGGKAIGEADPDLLGREYRRLTDWLKAMPWSELRDPHNLEAMGTKVDNLGLSREELYDLYSVLLLIEQMEATGIDTASLEEDTGKADAVSIQQAPHRPGGRPKRAGKEIKKSFIYNGGDDKARRLHSLYAVLLDEKWIAADTAFEDFEDIFSGEETSNIVVWKGKINVLTELFKQLVKKRKLMQLPKGESIWMMVNARFRDKQRNKEFGHERLGATRPPSEYLRRIAILMDLLDPTISKEQFDEKYRR